VKHSGYKPHEILQLDHGRLNGGALVSKGYMDSTHRLVPPEQTLERVRPFLPVMGITRVANVTGLDTIGIPVVMVTRPNSRSISVSQGKGFSRSPRARVSTWRPPRLRASWNRSNPTTPKGWTIR
jgi:hypothetical protein